MAAEKSVKIEADAYMVCLTHALSTENEEVMGLLIGEEEGCNVSHVHSVIMLRRSDKRKDRVEISPEQLSDASTRAEYLGQLTNRNRPMRVLGWYHSHPHITVWPSHVDVRTQAMYQIMDNGFIGLIFSCFNEDNNKTGRIRVTCFQSVDISDLGDPPQLQHKEIELEVVNTDHLCNASLEALVELPNILSQEEEEAYQKTFRPESLDLLSSITNGNVFTKSLCHLMDVMCGPLMKTMENRMMRNKQKVIELLREKDKIQKELSTTV